MNKSLLTNIIAACVTIIGYFSPIYGEAISMVGIFALSGGVTNWLAIYMLFDKIPFIYGSGVIPNRFEDFKLGIKNLIIEEFFTKEHIEKFFQQNGQDLSVESIGDKIDFNKVFEGLVEAIIESPLGGMLAMFGGKEALQPLKEPIIEKLKNIISELAASKDGGSKSGLSENLIAKIESIIEDRLADLTPKMVKDIIQKMIRKHLGWLVVWGGVFGGFIGFIFTIL